MIKFEEFITEKQAHEAKNIGILYHFTSLFNLYKIYISDYKLQTNRNVESNRILLKTYDLEDKKHLHYVSFTRNKNLYKHPKLMIGSVPTVRITIDGNKLSEKYRLYSLNDGMIASNKEAEECVLVKYTLPIYNYILKIEIPSLFQFKKEVYESGQEEIYYFESFISFFENHLSEDEIDYLNNYNFDSSEIQNTLDKIYDIIIGTINYDGILK